MFSTFAVSYLPMNQKIIHLATLTLLGFPLIGWVILWLLDGPAFSGLFIVTSPLLQQIGIGLLMGFAAGWGAWMIIRSPYMQPVRQKYGNLIREFNLSPWQIVYISLCAGIGEEILFRGVIQPYLGIWITAVLFVAIHGYLNPFDTRLFFYGVYMTLVIALIGYFSDQIGLYSAMAAHTAIDIVLLYQMSRLSFAETIEPENSFTGDNGPSTS